MQVLQIELRSIDRWKRARVGLNIAPVQIFPVLVYAKMAAVYSVRVQDRDDFENEVVTEVLATLVIS